MKKGSSTSINHGENITKMIDGFLQNFSKMTKHESDFIEEVIQWDQEKKTAFILAKKIFEDKW
jgi:hypothetical protein